MEIEMTLQAPAVPWNPSDHNIFGTSERNIEARIRRLLRGTLIDDERLTCIQTSHLNSTTHTFTALSSHQSLFSIAAWLKETKSVPVRFLSIPQKFSQSPLQVTKATLQHILVDLEVDLAFFEVIAAFGDSPRISETANDCFHNFETDARSFDRFYLHRFVDRDGEDDDYRIRQIGLYHKYNEVTQSHTFFFLQPHEDSAFDDRLRWACSNPVSVAEIVLDPYRVHQILLGTYFDNWRWYLKDVADEYQHESDKVFTADIHKVTFGITYEVLQSWRDLADRSLPLTAYFAAEQRIRVGLGSVPSTPTAISLSRQCDKLSSLITSTNVLLQRIDNVISLLSNTIDIRNQRDSAALNTHLYSLTKDTVDDSASVRIITLMSLLYLPASFVSTFFGMNFFNFGEDNLDTSRQIWIYVVTVVLLTIVTLAMAMLWKRYNDQRRNRRKAGIGLRLEVR